MNAEVAALRAVGTIMNLRPWSNRAPFRQVGLFLDGDALALDDFPTIKRDVQQALAAIAAQSPDAKTNE